MRIRRRSAVGPAAAGRLPPRRSVRLAVLHRHVRKSPVFVLEGRHQSAVAAVNVLTEFQIAGVVDKGGLIGQMHGDRRVELNIPLSRPIHSPDPLCRIAILRIGNIEKHLGVFVRV